MSPSDPRSRIVLHMNWHAQALPILLNGLPSIPTATDTTDYTSLPLPSAAQISSISPLAHVEDGSYRTPTYLVHGTKDDLIPWQQSQGFVQALQGRGVKAGFGKGEGKVHLFDLYRDRDGSGWESVRTGFEWVFGVVG